MIHIHDVRRFAIAALLLATACGDDGGDDDDVTPQPDAANNEAGAIEAGADEAGVTVDAGNIDGGGGGNPDGGTDLDARAPVPDGGAPDAGDPALQAALDKSDVRFDMQRADLVIPAFCRNGARCDLLDVTEQECLDQLKGDWAASVNGGDTPACLDAQLDFLSCGALLSCNAPDSACESDATRVAEACDLEDEDGG